MLRHLGLRRVELSVALVTDEQIRELNKTFRHKNKPTDVLAFPMTALDGTSLGDVVGASTLLLLGDVVVSIDTARRQAARRRRSLLHELTMLLAHGVLHLLGYQHGSDAEERTMTLRTRELETAAKRRAEHRRT